MIARGTLAFFVFALAILFFSDLCEGGELTKVATFGETRFRHPGEIIEMIVLSDGSMITTAKYNDTRRWSPDGTLLKILARRPHDPTSPLVVLPDGKRMLCISNTDTYLCDVETGEFLKTYEKSRGTRARLIRPGTTQFANDKGLWDWETGEKVRGFDNFLPGGVRANLLAFSKDGRFVYAVRSNRVRAWDLETDTEVVARYHDRPISAGLSSPDKESFLASCYGSIFLFKADEKASFLWRRKLALDEHVSASAWSPDGKVIAVYFTKRLIRLLDPSNGSTIRDIKIPDTPSWKGQSRALAFSPDGTFLYLGEGIVRRFRVDSGEQVFPSGPNPAMDSISSMSTQGDRLFVIGSRSVNHDVWQGHSFIDKWTISTGDHIERWRPSGPPRFWAGELSPSGRTFLLGTVDGRLIALDSESNEVSWYGTQNRDKEAVYRIAFLSEKRALASSSAGVSVINMNTYKEPPRIPAYHNGISPLTLSPDGNLLATVKGVEPSMQLWNTKTWKLHRELRTYPPFVGDCIFTPDSSGVLAVGARGLLYAPVKKAAPEDKGAPIEDKTGLGDFVVRNIPDGFVPRGMVPSPDGKHWAAIEKGHEKWNIVVGGFAEEGLTVHAKAPTHDMPQFLVWHSDGGSVFAANLSGTIDQFQFLKK